MPKILIIEDDAFVLDLLSEVLGYEKYEVICASAGEDGLKLAASGQPNVILCDITLGGMDGYAVLKALRADPVTTHIPLIFMTGRMPSEEPGAETAMGANGYLNKPASRQAILEAIRKHI